jgi:heme-degrading monooxygenase HmoA
MIIREWRGYAAWARADAYPVHFRSAVLPELRRTAGFLGACLGQYRQADRVEFLVLTRWQSLDAIRAFAGDDLDTAVVEPAAAAALLAYDRTVRHYEIIEEA